VHMSAAKEPAKGAWTTDETSDGGLLLAPRGLEGVVVADTTVGDVRGKEGFYHYREYSAIDLARGRSFEDVAHLLLRGHLPEPAESTRFASELAAQRQIPGAVATIVSGLSVLGGPMDTLRTAISALGTELKWQPVLDLDPGTLQEQVARLVAVAPTMLAAGHRTSLGLDPVAPRTDLGHAANYLWMLSGSEPTAEHARALEQYLIVAIDHGFNASTFAARVIASTGADLASAICGAVGALAGPLHGGAPGRALDMLDEVRATGDASEWVREAVGRGDRIMGFGHRVYKTDDPRAVMLREVARGLDGPLAAEAAEVERAVVDTLRELKPGRSLYANVEFYAGIVMASSGVPRELFTPTFAIARLVGWCAHVLEQRADNRLIRPLARYVGPPPPVPVPPPAV
jgi:citrate synthase